MIVARNGAKRQADTIAGAVRTAFCYDAAMIDPRRPLRGRFHFGLRTAFVVLTPSDAIHHIDKAT
jgi:hypothetical protein